MAGILLDQSNKFYNKYILTVIASSSNLAFVLVVCFIIIVYLNFRRRVSIYIIDFACYQGPSSHRIPATSFIEHSLMREKEFNTSGAAEFEKKVIIRSGLGNECLATPGMDVIPLDFSFKRSVKENNMVFFSVTESLLTKHSISPESIDILVINCSLHCPTPSIASMIINKFGFRSDVKSFNLSGMGCSAVLLSLSLAKDLLKVHKNSLALVLSTETISSQVYRGSDKSMLMSNCLFRVGGSAVVLSNRKIDKEVAKYELQHLIRTHLGALDDAYTSVFKKADDEGKEGMSLSKNVVAVAAEALKTNLTSLAPLVLPYSEQIRYALHFLWTKLSHSTKRNSVPNFKKAFDHFCIHAGGKAVIDGLQRMLKLSDWDVEPSKMTLYRFGNTSSSSTWYSLSYLEAKRRVKKGDIVFQLCFGSGFKCNSAVWKCVSKDMSDTLPNAWSDRIDRYPVDVPEVSDH